MIARIFAFLISLSPKIKKYLWKTWYQILARSKKDSNWKFMNYGFVDSNELKLEKEDEPDRESIQLYNYVATRVDVKNKIILEVGSGRGGGANYVARYLQPIEIVGIDLSPNAVELSQKFYNLKNLNFAVGDSENIPFSDNYFDVVLNVESSHCYASMEKFLKEVKRVLKPSGFFTWADLDDAKNIRFDSAVFKIEGMKIIEEKNITQNVLAGLDAMSSTRENAIENFAPNFIKKAIKTFAGVKGTEIYNGFKNGNLIYLSKVLQKI